MRYRRRRSDFSEYDTVVRSTSDLGALKALGSYGPETSDDVQALVDFLVAARNLSVTPFTRHSRQRNSCFYGYGEWPRRFSETRRKGPTIAWLKHPERLNWEMVVHEMAHLERFLADGTVALNARNGHGRRFVAALDDMTAQVLVDYPNLVPAPPQQIEERVRAQAASKPEDQESL